jgi:hypothetical protein
MTTAVYIWWIAGIVSTVVCVRHAFNPPKVGGNRIGGVS